jgi:hypothetical protein
LRSKNQSNLAWAKVRNFDWEMGVKYEVPAAAGKRATCLPQPGEIQDLS